jgi:nicotinamide riboside transporter PnuC
MNTATTAPKKPTTWRHVVAAYIGIVVAFTAIFFAIVSGSRDPYFYDLAVPTAASFRALCSLVALFCGIGSLFLIALVMDRGDSKQMVALIPTIALILVLLDVLGMRM